MRIPIPCTNHESLDHSEDMEGIVRNMGGAGGNRDVGAEMEVRSEDQNDDDHNEHLLAAGYTPLDDIDDLDFNSESNLYMHDGHDDNVQGDGVYMLNGGMLTFVDNNNNIEPMNLNPENDTTGSLGDSHEQSGWVNFDNTDFQNTSQMQAANNDNYSDYEKTGNYLEIADQALSILENDYNHTRNQDPNEQKNMTQTAIATKNSNEFNKMESSSEATVTCVDSTTSQTKKKTKKKNKKKKKNAIGKEKNIDIDIDADAIKRAMQNIEFKSQKSFESWTQQKIPFQQQKSIQSELSQISALFSPTSVNLNKTKPTNIDPHGLTSMSKRPNEISTQLSTIPEHTIIPSTPLRAFHRNTSASIKSTGRLSRSATIAEALSRIFEYQHLHIQDGKKDLTNVRTLNLHIIGADHVECASKKIIQTTFEPLIRWIHNSLSAKNRLFYHPVIDNLHIKLLGPNVPEKSHDTYTASDPLVLSSYSSNPSKEGGNTTVVCQRCCYHDYLDDLERKTVESSNNISNRKITAEEEMTVVLAFNAGIYGYNEWIPTLKRMLLFQKQILPFVITSYTLEEAEDDAEVIQDVLQLNNSNSNDNEIDNDNGIDNNKEDNNNVDTEESLKSDSIVGKCLWNVEINPFSSKVERKTTTAIEGRKYYENRAWQAYLFGTDTGTGDIDHENVVNESSP